MSFQRALVLGGSRSGKSFLAERLVTGLQAPWTYLASAQAYDIEMSDRISTHKARRGADWRTIEEPKKISETLGTLPSDARVLFDCASLWLTNHLLGESDLGAETDRLLTSLSSFGGTLVTVSNEVGSGIVPENALARRFSDAQGLLNQRLAADADLVVLVVAGLPLVLKGALPEYMT
ncbi:bifunctional adenosylcobinamide kinase/adenosylcobinamide-phosphate guanylyltransferase [Psychromarinibacter sp. S121]|uniref:bifunctional adenosylcobinamide kinase/adenosylcobinamide-phosphate guanylyltransferase n=1 Tax=Psychromarinibacter sp. S121 TaxID=3415127 RepID=UPI003C7D5D08